ncbi:MAG: formate--tetrahydrofolate ligase [Bacilli bacterium]|nr:formate--tetrahydrofolate ligase [Bacilli bacterium]
MKLDNIEKVGKKLGLNKKDIIPYGYYMGKIQPLDNPKGKLILVTAITPTKAGEGKTTTSIALGDALDKLGKKTCICLREPSLGPVFGLKGGATGGGKVTVEPSDDINLHFTGDFHALTSSINLVSAVIDNHIYQGNELDIDPDTISWKRALDMNDRELREIEIGLGPVSKKSGKNLNGIVRKDGFIITVAHEMMAIMCLAKSREDFQKRLGEMTVAYSHSKKPITVKDLKVTNAIMKLMDKALLPNIVQTSYNVPTLIHGGPFANIAHGCNSIIATKTALSLADYVVTEAGFGADLGAEKFLDIKCQEAGLKPDLVVLVATIRALKLHGGVPFEELDKENLEALKNGISNLERHLENMKKFGLNVIININRFASDTNKEVKLLEKWCEQQNVPFSLNEAFLKGVKGSLDLGEKVLKALDENKSSYKPLYIRNQLSVEDKIERISKEIYRAKDVIYSDLAKEKLDLIKKNGYEDYYICMAKTPLSFSDDQNLLGAPTNFDIHIKDIEIATGAKFIIPITGSIMRMPGLPKVPEAVKMEDR